MTRGTAERRLIQRPSALSSLRLLPAGNLQRFNIVSHVQFPKILYALTWHKGQLRPLEILVLVRPYGRIGSHNHAFDIISPILPPTSFSEAYSLGP